MTIRGSGNRPKSPFGAGGVRKTKRRQKMSSAAYEEQRRSYTQAKLRRKLGSAEKRGAKNRARALRRQLESLG